MKFLSLSLAALLLGGVGATTLSAQNGATELSRTDAYSGYNDVWGYTAPNGDEYAILGTANGTAFYDVTTPTAPAFVGFIGGPTSTWRDMKTHGTYCYIVTEGSGGMQIVDLSTPSNPTLVTTWGSGLWNNAHNIAIDAGTSLAYIIGSDVDMPVLDISNPTVPVHMATYSGQYVHDAFVQNGMAHLAEIYQGDYRIVSVNSLPSFPTLDVVATPGHFTHSVWVNATDTVAVTTDESSGGGLTFYDISNPNAIQLLSTWNNSNATVHNATIVGDRVFASWYTFGFACIDISDPSNPQQIATYDTSLFNGTGYDGDWGIYPFTQSGLVYLSDRERGLFVIQIDDPAMTLGGDSAPMAGSTTTLDISGALPTETCYLLFSFSNAGVNIFGTTFEVGPGWSLFDTTTTDASGNASFTLNIPAGVSGATAYFEAATSTGSVLTSNLFRLQVQ